MQKNHISITPAGRERLHREAKARAVSGLTARLDLDPLLQQIWDNEKDAAYDKLSKKNLARSIE